MELFWSSRGTHSELVVESYIIFYSIAYVAGYSFKAQGPWNKKKIYFSSYVEPISIMSRHGPTMALLEGLFFKEVKKYEKYIII